MRVQLIATVVVFLAGSALAHGGFRVETFENKFNLQGPNDEIVQHSAEYICEMRDSVSVKPDGTLAHEVGILNLWVDEQPLRFRFDTVTAVMSEWKKDVQWQVLQLGSNFRELIAHNPNRDPLNNQLRIVTYTDPMTFWLTDGTDVISGICNLS